MMCPILCNLEDQVAEGRFVGPNFHSIQAQEYQRRGRAGTFIAVDEWVIIYDVEQICSGHGEKIVMQKFAAKSSGRGVNRGLEKRAVTQLGTAAVPANLLCMDLQNPIHRQ